MMSLNTLILFFVKPCLSKVFFESANFCNFQNKKKLESPHYIDNHKSFFNKLITI